MLRDFHDRHVIPLFSHVHPVHPPPSLDSFRYCYSLVSSRAFTVSAYHGLALCPFADMLDHANPISEDHAGPYNNVDFRSDYWVCSTCGMVDDCEHDEDDASTTERRSDRRSAATCEIVSILPILPGEEIFNNYGRLDNSALLTHYGFALEDNEFDRITWTASEVLLEFDIEWSESAERLSALIESWPSGPGEEGENALVLGCPTKPSGDSPTDSSQLFINSDAKISRPLWILLALVVNPPNRTASLSAVCASLLELDTHQTSIFGGLESKSNATIRATSRDLAGAIRWLCRRRVEASCAPELSVDDILSLAQVRRFSPSFPYTERMMIGGTNNRGQASNGISRRRTSSTRVRRIVILISHRRMIRHHRYCYRIVSECCCKNKVYLQRLQRNKNKHIEINFGAEESTILLGTE